MNYKLLTFLLVLCVLVIGISQVSAETNTSEISDGTTFTDLQILINSNDTEIELNNDYTYNEDTDLELKTGININKEITINGNGYSINGLNTARIFNMNTSNVVLKNINLINGKADIGGLIIAINTELIINNCSFMNGNANYGAAIALNDGLMNIQNSYFINNTAKNGGVIVGSGIINILSTSFKENNANNDVIRSDNQLNIDKSTFENNNVDSIINANNLIKIKNSKFDGNNIICDNAVLTYENNTNLVYITFINSRLLSEANLSLKAIYKESINDYQVFADLTVCDKTIISFKNTEGELIGFDLTDDDGNEYTYNSRGQNNNYILSVPEGLPSGIYSFLNAEIEGIDNLNSEDYIIISRENKTSNTFTDLQNLIDTAIYTVELDQNYIYNETIDYALKDGILITRDITINGNDYTIDGANLARIFKINSCTVTLNNIVFHNGQQKNGAIIYAYDSTLIINSCFFENGKATTYGGAINIYKSNLTLYNSTFKNNQAKYGGAIDINGSTANLNNNNFIYNNAEYGGAIANNGLTNIENCYFFENKATKGKEIMSKAEIIISKSKIINTETDTLIVANKFLTITNTEVTGNILVINGLCYFENNTNVTFLTLQNKSILSSKANLNISGYYNELEKNYYISAILTTFGTKVLFTDENNNPVGFNLTDDFGNKYIFKKFGQNDQYILKAPANLPEGIYTFETSKIYGIEQLETEGYLIVNSEDIELNVTDLVKYYGGPERFEITLTEDGQPLANELVFFNLNGQTYNRTTDKNGKASIAINLNAGTYLITVTYKNIVKEANIIIFSTINGKDIVKSYKNGTQYYAYFTNNDKTGTPLANTEVQFNINGVLYTRTTNENGIAKLSINLNPDIYTLTAKNPITGEERSNQITVLSTINGKDITLYYKNGTRYTATFYKEDGSALANTEVQFNINGVIYTKTTDANGKASLAINLNAGDYVITAINPINGQTFSNTIKVLPIIGANDLIMSYKDGSKFEATLVDGLGNPLAGQIINFNVNGVFYHKETDANGIAKLTINLNRGEYIITSEYNGFMTSNKIIIH